jgi:rRNA maturation endonuclease Nob1
MKKVNKDRNLCQDCILTVTDGNVDNINNTSVENILMWEYECHQCQLRFKVPVPHGPTEEKNIKCTGCGSTDITREKTYNMEMAFCGG